jgi:FKBP-type peptidyl-prolyl cis-trans isomerase
MKSFALSLVALGLCSATFAADQKPAATPPSATPAAAGGGAAQFKDTRDRVSYAIGANIANSMKQQDADLNPDVLAQGLRETLGGTSKLSEAEIRETLMTFNQELRNKRMEKLKVEGEKNKKVGEEWLAANAKKPGVKTSATGLQHKELVAGKGQQVKAGDRVSVHYKGTLTDGTTFDSSYERGQPFVTSTLGGVIPGWLEALTNMNVGDKWELYIPSNLAYGEQGRPPKIPPSAPLVFEMEVLGIEPPQASAPGTPSLNAAPGGAPQIRVQPAQPGQPAK